MNILLAMVCLYGAQDPVNWYNLKNHNPFNPMRQMPQAQYTDPTPIPTDDQGLALKQAIKEEAAHQGFQINSLNARKTKVLDEENDIRQVRIYLGYDAEIEELISFMSALSEREPNMGISHLMVSARRPNLEKSPRRKTLNGNMILTLASSENISVPIDQTWLPLPRVLDFMDDVATVLPENSWLTHVQLKKGEQVTIQGTSENHTDVLRVLMAVNGLSDIKLDTPMTMHQNTKRFMVRANLAD